MNFQSALNNEDCYKDHFNNASQAVKKSDVGMKVEDKFLIDGGKSAVMTMT